MKKLIYSIALFLGMSSAMAQENRGTLIPAKIFQRSLLVGGTITGAHKTIDNSLGSEASTGNRQQFDVAGKVGYFVLHDLAIGGKVALSHYRVNPSGDKVPTRSTYILAGPLVRYYLDNGFFGEGSYALGVNNKPSGVKSDIMEVQGGVGYALFINPKVAIEPAINLTYMKEERFNSDTKFYSEFGPSFTIGMQIYLYRERGLAALR